MIWWNWGFSEHGNAISDSINATVFLDQLSNYKLFKKDPAKWNYFGYFIRSSGIGQFPYYVQPLSPRHGAPSCCGWRALPPRMESNSWVYWISSRGRPTKVGPQAYRLGADKKTLRVKQCFLPIYSNTQIWICGCCRITIHLVCIWGVLISSLGSEIGHPDWNISWFLWVSSVKSWKVPWNQT
jgi:hypothetical protein